MCVRERALGQGCLAVRPPPCSAYVLPQHPPWELKLLPGLIEIGYPSRETFSACQRVLGKGSFYFMGEVREREVRRMPSRESLLTGLLPGVILHRPPRMEVCAA